MANRALVLASLVFLAGCGAAASMDSAPKGPPTKGGEKLPPNDGTKREYLLEDGEGAVDPKKTPGDLIDQAQGGLPGPGGPAPAATVVAADKPAEKPKDEAARPGGGGGGLKAAVVVDSSTPLGNGRLTQAQIAKILEQGGDVFGDCYTLGAGGANKDFRATVTVKATIGPAGNVNAVEVTKSTANNPKVDACVAQAFKKVKFPAPSDGATSVITFPITFNGIEMVQ
jgi:TonB family protein